MIMPFLYKNKRVLVTGGAGFIGSHLVDQLVLRGAHVTVLDNFSTGNMGNLTTSRDDIYIVQGDIINLDYCLKATAHADIIFHLAALVSIEKSFENPKKCHAVNVEGTRNLLKAAVTNNVTYFIFSSSAAAYGDQKHPCSEKTKLSPKSPYATSKIAGEKLCTLFAKKHGLKTTSLRYFNVYGKHQNTQGDYAAVVAKFKCALKRNEPLEIYGDGKQTRDFTPVACVVEANLLMGIQEHLSGDVFNIASGKSINLFELIKKLASEIGIDYKKIKIIYKPAREGDIVTSEADCSKYQKFTSENADFSLQFKYIQPKKTQRIAL